ncbi:MAG: agmatinase [Candidatus Goldbacteria bacterium]|nr:agmatinase [Candidatus Goldiibacteriota bacterium]
MKFKSKIKFVGSSTDYNKSQFVICGIPYDVTSTFRHGSQNGPDMIRYYSGSLETFSPLHEKDITDFNFVDVGDMIFKKKKPVDAVKTIENYVSPFVRKNKKVIYLGGEHLVTFPVVKKYHEKYKDLKVLYFDAHADMRMDFNGNKLSHATVARRIVDVIGVKNIYMFGIRSFERKEYGFIRKNGIFCVDKLTKIKSIINKIKNYPVYVSLDLDVFDPSCLSGVGNPEPGGIFYDDFVEILLPLFSKIKKNIVSLDVVELMSKYDLSGNSAVFASKIIRELILTLI